MTSISKAPGKIILFGEHFVVHGNRAILGAINKYATVTSEKTNTNNMTIRQSELADILGYGKSRLSYLVEDMCLQKIIIKENGNIFLTEKFGALLDGWTDKEREFSKY